MTSLTPKELQAMFSSMDINLKVVSEKSGISPKSLYNILNKKGFRSKNLEEKFQNYAAEVLAAKLPWDQEWSKVLHKLRATSKCPSGAMAVEREFGREVQKYHKILEVVAENPELKGRFFDNNRDHVGTIWFVHIFWLCLAGWGQEVPLKTDKATAQNNAETAAKWMIAALDGLAGVAVELLRFKATMNIFVGQWNSVKAEHRSNSQRLRKQIENLKFFDVVDKQVALAPDNVVPLVNALAVASAFKERERYVDLEARITEVDQGRLVQIKNAPNSDNPHMKAQYDTDFNDYRDWVETSCLAKTNSISKEVNHA